MPDWLLPLLLAPAIGSFAALLIRRLPHGRPVALARSQCEACHQVLGLLDLVPLVSFVVLGGHCRRCRAPIALAHPAAELACFGIAAWAAMAEPDALRLWLGCGLGWTLLALSWIDIETMLLPDRLTLPLLVGGLAATWLTMPEAVAAHAMAAAAGYLAFQAVAAGYRGLRGRDGLGGGDAKLMAAAGAWLGPAPLPTVVFMAAACGLLLAAALRLAGRSVAGGTALPFGPPLCLAIWLVWLGQDPVAAFLAQLSGGG